MTNSAFIFDAAHCLQIARELLEQPTAPYKEELPRAHIRAFAQQRPGLMLSEDAAGNMLLKYEGAAASSRSPLVLVAHLDHPGFEITGVQGEIVELAFLGGVRAGHAQPGQRVEFFEMGVATPTGKGELVSVKEKESLEGASARVTEGRAIAGGFAMWDFPGFSIENETIVTRCCDDLLGAAAALCTLDALSSLRPDSVSVWALFTRAEEVGFLGALEAIRLKTIPQDACVLSLECSKALGIAPQGEGVIVRVGDRSSIFDPELTEALRQSAETVRKENPSFKYQRKLMDGGSCEATAFCAHGYRSSGLTVPLGNYHNMANQDGGPRGIGPENVKVNDFIWEVQLLIELALRPELLEKRAGQMPAWVAEYAAKAQKMLS